MDYLSSAEIAKKWNVSQRRVAVFCKEGRVKGAVLIGRMWMIPKDAEKPIDPRRIMNKEEDLSDIINDRSSSLFIIRLKRKICLIL